MRKRKLSILLSLGMAVVSAAAVIPISAFAGSAATKATVKSAIKNNYISAIDATCYLKPGSELNAIFKKLAGGSDTSETSVDTKIKSFAFSTSTPANAGGSTALNIALKGNVYATFDSATGVMTIYSPKVSKDKVYANPDSAWTFSGMESLKDISGLVYSVNYGKASDADRMFYDCSSLTDIDFTKFDISSVTTSEYILDMCNNLNMVVTPNENEMTEEASIALPGIFKEKSTSGQWGTTSYVSINATNPPTSKTLYRYTINGEAYNPDPVDPNAAETLAGYNLATGGSQTAAGKGYSATAGSSSGKGQNANGSTGGSDSLYPGGGGYYGGGSGGTLKQYKFSGGGGSGYAASKVNGEDTSDVILMSGANYGDGRVKITFIGVTDPDEDAVYSAYDNTTITGTQIYTAINAFFDSGLAVYVNNGTALTAYLHTVSYQNKRIGYSVGGAAPSGTGYELVEGTGSDNGAGYNGKSSYNDLLALSKDSGNANTYIKTTDKYTSTLIRSASSNDVIGIAFTKK